MPYYKIDREKYQEGEQIQLRSKSVRNVYVHPDGEDYYVQTIKALSEDASIKKITKSTFNSAIKSNVQNRSGDEIPRIVTSLLAEQSAVDKWQVEPYSKRKSDLNIIPLYKGAVSLRATFGAGRSDTIYIGRSMPKGQQYAGITLKLTAISPDDVPVSVGPILTTDKERPWLEIEPQVVTKDQASELYYDFGQLTSAKLEKADRIVLAITTEADEGALFMEQVDLVQFGAKKIHRNRKKHRRQP
ncbi:MAG: hypothetical protein IIA59_09395 [Candidatus Marinimicrobia bacterium]|nr:hypothetical protein [Candidatus Neomarinimicrobiota bacterium]